jgi:hypothetical protein
MARLYRQRRRGEDGIGNLSASTTTTSATTNAANPSVMCRKTLVLVMLLLLMGWHLFFQKQSPVSVTPPLPTTTSSTTQRTTASNPYWWESYVESSLSQGPLTIPLMPFNVSIENDKAIIQILKQYHINPQQQQKHYDSTVQWTIIDIGLPSESILFAKSGYYVFAFEARQEGIQRVQNGMAKQLPTNLQDHITLYHTALGNVSNVTMSMYNALDSSSLLSSAVQSKKEKPKFEKYGQTMETVHVEQLDTFLFKNDNNNLITTNGAAPTTTEKSPSAQQPQQQRIVAMKIDTQGVEPEIFMGSRQLLASTSSSSSSPPPLVIVTEYCTRLRVYEELSIGPHLLRGLGYTCYLRPTVTFSQPLMLSPQLDYCGDFVCIHHSTATKYAASIQ